MQGQLFDSGEKPKTRPATTPGWVIDELVRYGIRRETALKFPTRQAFAVLHRCRERKNPGEAIAKRKREIAAALVAWTKDDLADSQTAVDLVAEAAALLDGANLAAIARAVADVLAA